MGLGGEILVVLRQITGWSNEEFVQRIEKDGYRVRQILPGEDPLSAMKQMQPLVTCFQYDYPDLPGLAELRLAKERVPAIPFIMITQAHSESLAVWAFRARVWDYFVQPVDMVRFLAVLKVLFRLRSAHKKWRGPPPAAGMPTNPIPPEARVRGSTEPGDSPALELAISYVDRNLHTKLVQAVVADICGLSPFQFSRRFKRRFGVTFQEYVLRKRISEATRLLGHPEASVTDVCYNVGFHDLSYFTRTFQRYVGRTPSEHRLMAIRSRRQSGSKRDSSTKQQHARMDVGLKALSLLRPGMERPR